MIRILFWVFMALAIVSLITDWVGGPTWAYPLSYGFFFVEIFLLGLVSMGNPLSNGKP